MIETPRRAVAAIVVFAVIATIAAGCTQAPSPPPPQSPPVTSASPDASASAAPSPSPDPTASPDASASGSPVPATAEPTSPSPSASAAGRCRIEPQEGRLPSDRLRNVVAGSDDGVETLTFRFGPDSLGPAGPPRGEISRARPPFTFGPSGKPIEMEGERVVQVVFRNMSLQNDVGQPVYDGPTELRPDGPILRHAVEFDESEGVIGWYVGFDGPGCVEYVQQGRTLTLRFPPG